MINILYTIVLKIRKNTIPFLIKTVKAILIFLIESAHSGKECMEYITEIFDIVTCWLFTFITGITYVIIVVKILPRYFPNIESYLGQVIILVCTFPITVLMVYLLPVMIIGIIAQTYKRLCKM